MKTAQGLMHSEGQLLETPVLHRIGHMCVKTPGSESHAQGQRNRHRGKEGKEKKI